MHPQLPLPFTSWEGFNFEGFIAGDNQLVLESLQTLNEPFIFLWGDSASGKTHLLQSTCQQQAQQGYTTSYLPLKELLSLSEEVLDGMSSLDLICVDDIDAINNLPLWEEALFNLFNQIRQKGGRLVISSSASPQQSNIALHDLKSRLSSGLSLNLRPLNDDCTVMLLQTRAQKLGLELNTDAAKYLITHYPRDPSSLQKLLSQLDQQSLASQRKLTIPFIKTALAPVA